MNRSTKNRLCLSVAIFLALLLVAGGASAQISGKIQGFVKDPSGAVMPGVTVTAENSDTGAQRSAETTDTGFYVVRNLASGNYNVSAALEGFQTVRREGLRVQVGQTIDINFDLGLAAETEIITVTSEAPLVEISRSSAASYVSEEEIESLPIVGRDFKDFALLAPTVQSDPIRGFITMSGQRGIYSGLNIDGSDAKSAFFAYGLGGEATENDGLVVAQDSVKEFQIVTSSFSPEFGANSGGFVNVVTKSGGNDLSASAFYFFRDDSMAADEPASPLDVSRGNTDASPADEFDRSEWGVSLGGPIVKNRTHFFVSYDQTARDEPISRDLRTPGIYDLIMTRAASEPGFAALLDGFTRNADGSASGNFLRSVDNLILFGKIDHQIGVSHSLSGRVNFTDYERISSFKDEESSKLEDTTAIVGQLVSVIGSSGVNEFRIQDAEDNLDRLSLRVGEQIEAQVRFRFGDFDSVGKFDFLPILVEEEKMQVQDNFSYLFGDHDLKFGVSYSKDDLAQVFKGSADGRYDFRSADDFLNNIDSGVRIYFGNINFPNYDESQELLGIYAQDSYKPNANLTLSYGIRYGATYNPDNLPHLLAEGRDIPDDTDNLAPRFGFAYSPGGSGSSVLRGGIGLFYGRTPTLLFASQVQENGLFPNFGRVFVQPGDIGHVPLGTPIDNLNPPAETIPSTSYLEPSFEDSETWRFNLGYERTLKADWVGTVDLVYADGSKLQSNVDLNRTYSFDEFGRPIASPTRPDPTLQTIFVRRSFGESEYTAVTLKVEKRWNGRYQLRAHYTWSQDKDTDSNERSATSVTVSSPNDPRYDWGLAERDVENRLLLSGMVELVWGIQLSGIAEYRDGRPFDPTDSSFDFAACGFTSLGFNCPNARPVVDGQVLARNSFRDESIQRVDLRLSKYFDLGDVRIGVFGEAFNVFDDNSWEVEGGFSGDRQRDPNHADFGLADDIVTTPRQYQLGVRLSFR